jgi:type IV pilus assembly protein PilV
MDSAPQNPGSRRAHPRAARRGAEDGMALIEVLVSILLFAFGLLGLIGLEATAINLSVDAEDRNRAALFASDVASSMWTTNSVTPTAGQLATWQTNIANTATETGLPTGILTITPTAGTINSADIKITWKPITDNTKVSTTRQLTTRVILP